MGCCGDREKGGPTKESQKWQYITLTDFKSTSAWNTPAYVWLWILFISTIVIYAVDTFTAVNLLVFNKWSSQVKPYIPFDYSKWIFAGCIIFSWVLWGFEWLRAIRVINRGGVAESYMDPLAVSLQSMRAQGWRRFLVFAELTKSKKGMDLVAFFSYFAFKGALRIILAEGPRQVINTLTLIAVVKADFVDKTVKSQSGIGLFWYNLNEMWQEDKLQVVIIFSMMYSLFIWVISIICLASAALMYIVFIWHYIPQQDGGLSSYCKRKVDKRLERIVESKVKAAIEDEERKKRKAEEKDWKAAQKADKKGKPFEGAVPFGGVSRQPTLPNLDTTEKKDDDGPMDNYTLRRTDTSSTSATLPLYASRPATRNEDRPPLPTYTSDRPPAMRSATNDSQWTTTSYESDAPLLQNAGQAGESMPIRPPTAFSRQDSNASYGRQDQMPYGRQPMPRTMTSASQRPYSPAPGMPSDSRPFSPMSRTDFSQNAGTGGPQYPPQRAESPYGRPMRAESPYGAPLPGPPSRQGTTTSFDRSMPPRVGTAPPTAMSRQPTAASTFSNASFSRPIPPSQRPSQPVRSFTSRSSGSSDGNSYEMKSNPYIAKPSTTEPPSSYVAFNPNRTASPAPAPQRSNTTTTQDYFTHKALPADPASLSAPAVDNRATIGYGDIVDAYGEGTTPASSSPDTHQPGYNPHR